MPENSLRDNNGNTDRADAGEFAIKFRATQSGQLSQMLGVSSRIAKAEAYSLNNEQQDVALRCNIAEGATTVRVRLKRFVAAELHQRMVYYFCLPLTK